MLDKEKYRSETEAGGGWNFSSGCQEGLHGMVMLE